MKNISQKDIYSVSAYTIDNNPEGVKTLIRKYGVSLPANASKGDVDNAFSALLKTSKTFRRDFSALATQTISKDNNFLGFLNFVEQGDGFSLDKPFNMATGGDPSDTNWLSGLMGTTKNTQTTGTTSSGKSFSDYIDPKTVQNIINTGLNIWASSKGTTADTSGQLDTGRTNLPPTPQTDRGNGGMGTGTIVLIVVGIVGALGTIIYFATKKK